MNYRLVLLLSSALFLMAAAMKIYVVRAQQQVQVGTPVCMVFGCSYYTGERLRKASPQRLRRLHARLLSTLCTTQTEADIISIRLPVNNNSMLFAVAQIIS